MANTHFGGTGLGEQTIKVAPNKPTQYTSKFAGTYADVVATGSIYSGYNWTVTYTSGEPWTGLAELTADVGGSGIIPISGSPSTSSSLGSGSVIPYFSMHYNVTEKEILHSDSRMVGFTQYLTDLQINVLEEAITSPPTYPDSFDNKYPLFNSGSSASGSYVNPDAEFFTAGDLTWVLSRRGFRTVPVVQPVLRYTLNAPLGWDMTYYAANINRVYSKSTLVNQLGIPSNYATIMQQDSDPGYNNTDGVEFIYGWLKQPPTLDTQTTLINITQEYHYGLYPWPVFGTRL